VVSLNANIETPEDSRNITGIAKLNNVQFSTAESITCWQAHCIDHGKTVKTEKCVALCDLALPNT